MRRYVPELARLDNGWIHRPFEAPAPVLAEAGVRLGSDYPHPLIAHPAARQRALTAFGAVKRGYSAVEGGCSGGDPMPHQEPRAG